MTIILIYKWKKKCMKKVWTGEDARLKTNYIVEWVKIK